jgi:hypothetical protein
VPTPGPSGVHGISLEEGEEGEEEEEVVETPAHRNGEEVQTEDEEDDEEEEEEEEGEKFYGKKRRRRRRQTDESIAAVRRNLRQQKQMLREAVDQAKDAGAAVDYHGQLGRKTLVKIEQGLIGNLKIVWDWGLTKNLGHSLIYISKRQ